MEVKKPSSSETDCQLGKMSKEKYGSDQEQNGKLG